MDEGDVEVLLPSALQDAWRHEGSAKSARVEDSSIDLVEVVPVAAVASAPVVADALVVAPAVVAQSPANVPSDYVLAATMTGPSLGLPHGTHTLRASNMYRHVWYFSMSCRQRNNFLGNSKQIPPNPDVPMNTCVCGRPEVAKPFYKVCTRVCATTAAR